MGTGHPVHDPIPPIELVAVPESWWLVSTLETLAFSNLKKPSSYTGLII